jgi:hypothetical protein
VLETIILDDYCQSPHGLMIKMQNDLPQTGYCTIVLKATFSRVIRAAGGENAGLALVCVIDDACPKTGF